MRVGLVGVERIFKIINQSAQFSSRKFRKKQAVIFPVSVKMFYRITINLAAVVQVIKTKNKLLSEPYDRRFVIGLWIK